MKYFAIILLAIVGQIAFWLCTFTTTEYTQALIIQFGRPVGEPVTKAGLHLKKPFIQSIRYLDQRILEWDGDPNQIPTKDKKYIKIDVTARWKIVDPLKFYQTVRNEMGAHVRLDDVIDGETRNIVSKHLLVEVVRNSNAILETGVRESELGERIKLDTMTIEPAQYRKNMGDIFNVDLLNIGFI